MKLIKPGILSIICLLLLSSSAIQPVMKKQSLLDDQIELKIPSEFKPVDNYDIRVNPLSDRSQTVVYRHLSEEVKMVLNFTLNRLDSDGIPETLHTYMTHLKDRFPMAEWISHGVREINGHRVGYFEMLTPGGKQGAYNLLFFTNLRGRMLICTFSSTEDVFTEWRPTGHEIMASLKIHKRF